MKLKLKMNLGIVFILAILPTTAFAVKGAPIPVKGAKTAPQAPVKSPGVSFYGKEKKVEIIGLTSEEYKDAVENGEDVDALLDARADQLCQFKHFKGAASRPVTIEKTGDIQGSDFDESSSVFKLVPRLFESVKGTQYVQRMYDGSNRVISAEEYEERKNKGGLYARAVSEQENHIPHIFFKDLNCSYTSSLTGTTQTTAQPQLQTQTHNDFLQQLIQRRDQLIAQINAMNSQVPTNQQHQSVSTSSVKPGAYNPFGVVVNSLGTSVSGSFSSLAR
jgi:hypothetical protein